MPELLHKDLTFNILGSCFEVYRDKGSGFLENVYQECLAIEFSRRHIPHKQKPSLGLTYKGVCLQQHYEPDFVCYESVIVEIKAVKSIADEHRAQVINYLKATDLQVGLLVNFGHYPRIQHERFVNQLPRNPRIP